MQQVSEFLLTFNLRLAVQGLQKAHAMRNQRIILLSFAILVAAPMTLYSSCGTASAAEKAAKAEKITVATNGDQLAFDKTKLKAKPGQSVTLTFKNTASKNSGLQHNWVLTQPEKGDAVGMAGIQAGPTKDYVPEGSDVLAHTKLVNPGESVTITFTAPSQPGDYPYICSFPGHYTTMKGVLTVK
jgi:azurin